MLEKIKRQKTVVEKKYFCDLCHLDGSRTGAKYQCKMCHRDVCSKHHDWDDRDHGDYPDIYCTTCWATGKPFRRALVDLESQQCIELVAIETEWEEAAKKAVQAEQDKIIVG